MLAISKFIHGDKEERKQDRKAVKYIHTQTQFRLYVGQYLNNINSIGTKCVKHSVCIVQTVAS